MEGEKNATIFPESMAYTLVIFAKKHPCIPVTGKITRLINPKKQTRISRKYINTL